MKKRILTFLFAIIMIIPMAIGFASCGPKGGDPDEPVDKSINNAEYIQYRNVMNTVASSFGTDIGLGVNENADLEDAGQNPMGFAVNTTMGSQIGLNFDDITSSFFAKLDEFKTLTPDHVYDDPMYGFEEAIYSCFKLPVQMVDAITWSKDATTTYGKTIWVGFDDPTMDETYYIVDKNGTHYTSLAYSSSTMNYGTGSDEPVFSGYYFNYTDVNYVSKDNFTFYLVTVSEDKTFNQIIVGDNKHNIIAFDFDTEGHITLNYSNGDEAKSRRLTSNTEINEQMKVLYQTAVANVNEAYLETIDDSYDYKLTVAEVDAVIERIMEDMGASEDNPYPGWGTSEDYSVVSGYYGTGKAEHIERLVIPSDFTKIDGDFFIYALSVGELVIPSTITQVMLTRSVSADRQGSLYNGDYWWEYVNATIQDFGINVYSDNSRGVVKKITLEATNGQESQIFSLDESGCLLTKDAQTLLYIPDAEIEEYDFTGLKYSYAINSGGYYTQQNREHVVDIKRLSMDVTIKEDVTNDPITPVTYWYEFPILNIFMSASKNEIYLDELNLYNFNQPEGQNGGIVWNPTRLFGYCGESGILNQYKSYIKKLNIYGNYSSFTYGDGYFKEEIGGEFAEQEEEILASGIEKFKIYTPYDYMNLVENSYRYLEKLGLITRVFVDYGNGQGHYQYDNESMVMQLMDEIYLFKFAYKNYILKTLQEEQGDDFRVKFVDEVEFKNKSAIIDDKTVETLVLDDKHYSYDLFAGLVYSKEFNFFDKDYPFVKEIVFDSSYGLNIKLSLSEMTTTEKIKVYIPSCIINFSIGEASQDYVVLYLPWTQETFDENNISARFNNGNGLDGFEIVFADEDDDTEYSIWVYEGVWDEDTNSNVKVLAGYYSNAEEINELTLPTDVNYFYNSFVVYANVKKIIIPANYINVFGAQEVDGFRPKIKNPLTLVETFTAKFEVASGSSKFKAVDGNLFAKNSNTILYYCVGAGNGVLDFRINGIEYFLDRIDIESITGIIATYKVTDVQVTTEMTAENPSLIVYKPVIETCLRSLVGYINLETLTFYCLPSEITEAEILAKIQQIKLTYPTAEDAKIREVLNGCMFVVTKNMVPYANESWEDFNLDLKIYGEHITKIDANLGIKEEYYDYVNSAYITFDNIYLNDEALTAQKDSNKFTDDSMLADYSEITEITITNETPKNIVYVAGTITTVRLADGLTTMDGVFIDKIINFDYLHIRDLHVYLPSSVTRMTGGMATDWGGGAITTFHFDMTKEEFVNDIIGENEYLGYCEMFSDYSIVEQYYDYENYKSAYEFLVANDYSGIYDYAEWLERNIGYKFEFVASEE